MITNNSSVPGKTVGNAIDYLNQLDTGTKPRRNIEITKEDLIKLVTDAFYQGYWKGGDPYPSVDDDWRYSSIKKELEKLTNEEYIGFDLVKGALNNG